MRPINISVVGCDDATNVVMLMSEQEMDFLIRLATRINDNSEYGCQPRVSIESKFPTDFPDEVADEVDDE